MYNTKIEVMIEFYQKKEKLYMFKCLNVSKKPQD